VHAHLYDSALAWYVRRRISQTYMHQYAVVTLTAMAFLNGLSLTALCAYWGSSREEPSSMRGLLRRTPSRSHCLHPTCFMVDPVRRLSPRIRKEPPRVHHGGPSSVQGRYLGIREMPPVTEIVVPELP
jgi:hypothetical protein